MPTIWDLLPVSPWPTQPFTPPDNPDQGSAWAPSPAAPWESATSTPDYLAPDALASSGPWDDDRCRQMLADAKRASDFVNWTFGPPSVAPRAPTAAPIRALWPATPSGDNAYPDTHASPWDGAEEPAAPSGNSLGMAARRNLSGSPPTNPDSRQPPAGILDDAGTFGARAATAARTVGLGASAAASALATAILLGLTTRTARPEDDEFHPQYVVRGGESKPKDLRENYQNLKDVEMPGLYGMSSSSAPELSVDQIAAVARYPNGQISYTIVPEVNALGYDVLPTPILKNPLHASIVDAPGISELSDDRAAALSVLFRRHIIPNPYRAP
jgi:hypothetical protein